MYCRLTRNEFRRNIGNNVILLLFLSLSVTLVTTVFLLLGQLFTSISTMYETARPPHFLQMHKGVVNQQELNQFNQSYPGLVHAQTSPMIDVFGEDIIVVKQKGAQEQRQFTLADCRLDISLVKQNKEYDLLLNAERRPLHMNPGEIGIPVILLEQYDIEVGDTLVLRSKGVEKKFVAAAYVYDGQMNSTLCSSTRFLIHDTDFDALLGAAGETEYLIEAYFDTPDAAAAYQTAYEERGLPQNGQAITYSMIFLLSAMTDIMMALLFFLTGILLVLVAMLCLRYMILTSIEKDIQEIGTLKAIGIPYRGICQIYLSKIRILMLFGCIIGFFAAQLLTAFFAGHMERTFGKQSIEPILLWSAAGGCALVYLLILGFARKVLGNIRKVTVIDALVREKGLGKEKKSIDGIHRARHLSVNLLVGLREMWHGYGMMFFLFLLLSFLVLVPYQVTHTMEDARFATYMGIGVHDAMIEVEQADLSDSLDTRREKAEQLLSADTIQYSMMRSIRAQSVDAEGNVCSIPIETGEQAGEGLQYLEGHKPQSQEEIALSMLVAQQLGKKTGEQIAVEQNGRSQQLVVSGIYQDITSGGRTAKAKEIFQEAPTEKYTFLIDFTEGEEGRRSRNEAEKLAKVEAWRTALGTGYHVEYMKEYGAQTLGGVTVQMRKAVLVVFGIGAILILLIGTLFLRLRFTRTGACIAAKRAMGIPFTAICKQELYPVLLMGGGGMVLGMVLSIVIGDDMVSVLLGILGLGIRQITFLLNPWMSCLVIPLALLGILTVTVLISCFSFKKMEITRYLNEA